MQDTSKYQPHRQILLNPKDSFALSAQISNANVTTNTFGKKIIKAGTVLDGDDFNLDPTVVLTVASSKVAVTGVTADKSLAVNVGKTVKVNASVVPTNASDKGLEFSSDNKLIFTVETDGTIKGVKTGHANLIVKAHGDESKTATVPVTVS